MQNKTFLKTLLVVSFLALPAFAQDAGQMPNLDLGPDMSEIDLSNKKTVDFPARTSLDTMEMATLPAVNETNITGPQPLSESVSPNDYPSEQLLGRLNQDVFEEMAELERDNAYLKLQIQKAQMKNDLEKLRATYRQDRLDEIAKREDVIRTRIQWWQEQEKLRLAIAKKQAEEEALERKIAEQEATRDKVREEAMKRMAAKEEVAAKSDGKEPVAVSIEPMEDLYTLDSIRGVGKNLTAKIKSKSDGEVMTVKKDDILPSGYVVKKIEKDGITVAFGNKIDKLIFRPAAK